MPALFAFTGSPDHVLADGMAQVLAHRGRLGEAAGAGTDAADRATIGVRLPRADTRLGGLAATPTGSHAVAVAGRLPIGVTPAGLLRDFHAGGPRALEATPGDWVIVARDEHNLHVLRDGPGIRTVYWGRNGARLFIAVEPKAVVATAAFPRHIDPGALAQFLTFSFVAAERTMLAGLHELPAGHRLTVDLASGSPTTTRWFVHEDVETADGNPDEWVSVTRRAVDHAVEECLPVGQAVATFLSGGLDSSIVTSVAAAACRARGDPLPTAYSLHFGTEYPNELSFARAVAAACGVHHREVEVRGRDLAPHLRRLVWHLDEPIGDPVTAGNFALAEVVSRDTTWVLNGEGGDPVFGGPKNLPMLLAHWYAPSPAALSREEQYLATWMRAGDEVQRLLHPDLRAAVDRERDLIAVVRPYLTAERPRHFLNKLMVANMRLKGAHLILPKVDRMLGAHGVTPLSPLFSPELIRLSLRMPPTAKLRDGVEKWVLKQAYGDVVPRAVVTRPKSGMRVPVQSWFRDDLERLAKDILSPRAVRRAGIFDPARVKDVLAYRTGRDGLRLWMLVTFELWRRLVVEREPL